MSGTAHAGQLVEYADGLFLVILLEAEHDVYALLLQKIGYGLKRNQFHRRVKGGKTACQSVYDGGKKIQL